ncbi:hypothetical protein P9139_11985 [Curtobacterium flaccumfaciens]|nr:hypothetical protein P9139_11985 [Curtobacterium flaccumfaciens]
MIIDGISDAHRGTWTRLTRLRSASITIPTQTTRVVEPKLVREDTSAA